MTVDYVDMKPPIEHHFMICKGAYRGFDANEDLIKPLDKMINTIYEKIDWDDPSKVDTEAMQDLIMMRKFLMDDYEVENENWYPKKRYKT